MHRCAVLFVLVGVGCGTGTGPTGNATPSATTATPPTATLPEGRLVDGCYVNDGAPDPYACERDEDCMAGGLLEPRCVMNGVTHAHSRAYHAWQTRMFDEHCGVRAIVPPSVPLDCEIAVRCEASRCVNACSDTPSPEATPTVDDATLDAMERSELEALCARGSTAACDRLGH